MPHQLLGDDRVDLIVRSGEDLALSSSLTLTPAGRAGRSPLGAKGAAWAAVARIPAAVSDGYSASINLGHPSRQTIEQRLTVTRVPVTDSLPAHHFPVPPGLHRVEWSDPSSR
jgi:hypothetical protein